MITSTEIIEMAKAKYKTMEHIENRLSSFEGWNCFYHGFLAGYMAAMPPADPVCTCSPERRDEGCPVHKAVQSDADNLVKRVEEICREFDDRLEDVGLLFARLELAKALAEAEISRPAAPPACDHKWVSADNEVVSGGEICIKCHAIRATVCTCTPDKWDHCPVHGHRRCHPKSQRFEDGEYIY